MAWLKQGSLKRKYNQAPVLDNFCFKNTFYDFKVHFNMLYIAQV